MRLTYRNLTGKRDFYDLTRLRGAVFQTEVEIRSG
jgi:hypothetical protein